MKKNQNYFYQITSLIFLSFSHFGHAHGVLENPASREQLCGVIAQPWQALVKQPFDNQKLIDQCRPMLLKKDGSKDESIYNFMGVLSHSIGRSDKNISELPKHVCGFGSEKWVNDEANKTPWDTAMDWPTVTINQGEQYFVWNINWGNHFSDTEEFVYWITKPDFKFDPNKELTWDDFESTPFCKLKYDDTKDSGSTNSPNNQKKQVIADKEHNKFQTLCNVPKRDNRAVIYGEWGRNKNTYERFHTCVDVIIDDKPGTITLIKSKIAELPSTLKGQTSIDLDGSQSIGSNLTYLWSVSAVNPSPYFLTNADQSTAKLNLNDIDANQDVSVTLLVTDKNNNASASSTQTFTHQSSGSRWRQIGLASVNFPLKAGDRIQIRLIDQQGQDHYFPEPPVNLSDSDITNYQWVVTLADKIKGNNPYGAEIGIISNEVITPDDSSAENMIFVPKNNLNFQNGYISVINEECSVRRKVGSNSYWLGYDVLINKTPVIINFEKTGINLNEIILDPGTFNINDLHILNDNQLQIDSKPNWVTKTNPGYIGFHGPNNASYGPFENKTTATCLPQL